MTEQETIIMPLGEHAGTEALARMVIYELNLELNYLASALERESTRIDPTLALSPEERVRGQTLKDAKASEAYHLRKFEHAAWLIFWQMLTPAERAEAEAKVAPEVRESLLKKIQDVYGLTLPDWLRPAEEGTNP